MLLIGIDDAGRGPVIGPMVLAGVLINEDLEEHLEEIGVKDSKLLTPEQRENLAVKIKEVCKRFSIHITTPKEIDNALESDENNLNKLEASQMAKVLNELNTSQDEIKVIIDCPSINIEKWQELFISLIQNKDNLEIICKHKADAEHPVVGAASILAKTTRDAEIEKLKDKVGIDFGSGYPADPKTKEFLKEHYKDFSDVDLFRLTWGTYKNVVKDGKQKKLF